MKNILMIVVSIFVYGISTSCNTTQPTNNEPVTKNKNILFIAIDDMKPILGAYGDDFAISPNIDKLADQGVVFNNNHCQYAVCGPSRASLMSGQRPDETQILDLNTLIRDKNPDVVTLPQYFKKNGYNTYAIGKIYDPRSVDKKHDDKSWTEYVLMEDLKFAEGYNAPEFGYYQSPENLKKIADLRKEAQEKGLTKGDVNKYVLKKYKVAWEKADVPDDAYLDGAIVNGAIELLNKVSKQDKPFFLAVGFKRPHLPFNAPTKYWDMYDESKVPLSLNQEKSDDGFELAYQPSWELSSYKVPGYDYKEIDGVIRIPEKQQRQLIHGYYAATTYVDAQVGKLIAELKKEGLEENTIIILWGDHGWHLGDHSLWNKHTNFEQATKSPMIIVDPSINKKIIVNSPTEFVDIYPTLCDLANIKTPQNLAGVSLKPLINGSEENVKKYAISEITRGSVIGYTLRSNRYRYTAWVGKDPINTTKLSENTIIGEELYDYDIDPLERKSYINDPEHKAILIKMREDFEIFFNDYRTKK